MDTLTPAEREVADRQGWNSDSLVAVLTSWEPAEGLRLDHMRAVAAIENEGSEDE